jgi:hypothetical protein
MSKVMVTFGTITFFVPLLACGQCDSTRAKVITEHLAAEAGLVPSEKTGDPVGPQAWESFVSKETLFVQVMGPEAMQELRNLIGTRSFFFVYLRPKTRTGFVTLGGGFWSFVDARTCSVLASNPDK